MMIQYERGPSGAHQRVTPGSSWSLVRPAWPHPTSSDSGAAPSFLSETSEARSTSRRAVVPSGMTGALVIFITLQVVEVVRGGRYVTVCTFAKGLAAGA